MKVDSRGLGYLGYGDARVLLRKILHIGERLVSDTQLSLFFAAIDLDRDGCIDFGEFLKFINIREPNTALRDQILTSVKRVVRLALFKQKMSVEKLEYKFYNAKAEGIIESTVNDNCLGPEEMRRFFRKVLGIGEHESPDRHLAIAFKAMDKDRDGRLDADEFMNFIRLAITEESCLSPRYPSSTEHNPSLFGGMRGALPDRSPRSRPGTTPNAGTSGAPFCFSSRDLPPQMRFSCSTPTLLVMKPDYKGSRTESPLLPSGLPRIASAQSSPSSPSSPRKGGRDNGGLASEEGHFSATPMKGSVAGAGATGGGDQLRGNYLNIKNAEVLNRVEQQLFKSGIDVRGHYHKIW